jgi:HEAT repeat protein
MRQAKGWQQMVAWALVGVLVVGWWALPGWAAGGWKPEKEMLKPAEGEVAGLLAAVDDEFPIVKGMAFRQLATFDVQVLRGILKQPEIVAKKAYDLLKDEKNDAYTRANAIYALSRLSKAKPYVKDFVDILKGKEIDTYMRTSVAYSLANFGNELKPYFKDLSDFLKDKKNDEYIRRELAFSLSKFHDVTTPYAQELLETLKNETLDPNARANAASALGNLGDAAKPYAKDISDVLKNKKTDSNLRGSAALALGNLGVAAQPYIKDILSILKDEKNDTYPLRGNAASALGNLGDIANPYIKDILDFLKNEKIGTKERSMAASALDHFSNMEKHVKDIRNFLKDEKVDADVRGSVASALGNLGDVAKPYVQEIHNILKDKNIDAYTRASAASSLGNLGDAAKPYAKDICDFLKDKKIDVYHRANAVVALSNLGDAAKPYIKDIRNFLKDEKIDIHVRSSATSSLGNLGDTAKPYTKDWVNLLREIFLQTSYSGESEVDRSSLTIANAIIKLGGLKLSDVLPIVNAIYGNTPASQAGRFLVKTTTLGEKETVTLLNWVGKPKTIPKNLTHDEAKTTLQIFQTAWDASTDLPELRTDLATQTREITNNRKILWQADDIPLLTRLATSLKTGGYTTADIDSAIQSIAIYKWGTTIGQTLITHILFWIGLIFFYPKSPQIQAIFFWNPWVRTIAGLGYVGFLLTWIPFLRDRLLAPFRTSLLADANLLNQDPNTHYFPTSQARPRNSSDLESLPKFQGQLILEGESGLGKTMYLRQLVQTSRRNTVYLTAQRCENGVLEAIQDKLEGNAKDPNFLQSLIYSRALDICIDGLNEVSPDTRAKITQFLERNFQGNFILTTQPLNGWNPPKTAKIYELQPLSPDQIREFLHSRIDTLPASSLITGLEYIAACDKVFAQYNQILKDTPTDEAKKIRRIFSNPMDLTLIAHTIAANEAPELLRLQEQDYKRMRDRYSDRFNQDFPLKQFSEAVYNMRLNDQDSIPPKDFGDELEIMEEAKMVIARTSREVTEGEKPTARTLWNFRHDKILEYFLVQQFLGKTPEIEDRILKHIDDPRFRGVYFLLADLLPFIEAQALRETLIQYAVDTQDHTVSDRFVELLRPRRPN